MDNNKKEILEALEKYKGIVTNACGSIGLARSTYYKWLIDDPEFKLAVDEVQETAIDFVEGKLMEKISGISMLAKSNGNGVEEDEEPTYTLPPSDTAIIFYLKTKGKNRGYQETVINKNVNYNTDIPSDKIKEISDKLDDSY